MHRKAEKRENRGISEALPPSLDMRFQIGSGSEALPGQGSFAQILTQIVTLPMCPSPYNVQKSSKTPILG